MLKLLLIHLFFLVGALFAQTPTYEPGNPAPQSSQVQSPAINRPVQQTSPDSLVIISTTDNEEDNIEEFEFEIELGDVDEEN